jgi:hypothetical protein
MMAVTTVGNRPAAITPTIASTIYKAKPTADENGSEYTEKSGRWGMKT